MIEWTAEIWDFLFSFHFIFFFDRHFPDYKLVWLKTREWNSVLTIIFNFRLHFSFFLMLLVLKLFFHFFSSCCNHHRSQSTLHWFLTEIYNSWSDNEHDGVSFPFHSRASSPSTHPTAEFSSLLSRCRCKMEIFLTLFLSTIWRHNKRRVENYRKTAEVSVKSIMNFPTMLDDASVLNSLACWKPPLSTMETLHVICANESNFNVEAACSRVLLSRLATFLRRKRRSKSFCF